MVIDMPASFPSSVKTWANKQDNIDDVFAGDINGTYHEIIAIENELMQVGYKPSARVATTQNGDLATAFANGQTVDGIVLSTGDRILIKDQTSGAENGIYIVNASGAPSRAIDANTAAHMVPGLMVYVREGAVNGKGTWKLTTTGTITLGTTPLTFENELASHKAESAQLIQDLGFDIRWYALLAVGDDWTPAIQAALDAHTHIYVPKGNFKFTTLIITKFGATIEGDGQLYGGSILQYAGTGTAITGMGTANYITLKNIQIAGVPTVSTDYYNTGSVGIDITDGATCLVTDGAFIHGFEILVKSYYNSFYNKFINSRFEFTKTCLDGFSINNLEVKGNRFQNFNVAITANGGAGILAIEKNTFERFNGQIVAMQSSEQGSVSFVRNYVEIYDMVDLPTNFPNMEVNGALPGKFGGNTLFTGAYRKLELKGNDLQLAGVFRVAALTTCDHFESVGNNVHLYETGNNLGMWVSNAGTFKTYYINDIKGGNLTGVGPYSRTYAQAPLPIANPFRNNYFYDCILDKELTSFATVNTPTLTNGWANSTDNTYGLLKVQIRREGLYLSGAISGTAKTSNVVCTLAAGVRPLEYGTGKTKCILKAVSDFGGGNVVTFLYNYTDGTITMIGVPASVANISLDGLFIPMRA
jgi:hypothetical protein